MKAKKSEKDSREKVKIVMRKNRNNTLLRVVATKLVALKKRKG